MRPLEGGLKTFIEVGRALTEIRDRRLYRESHGNVEAYCGERWKMSRPRAYELIYAAQVGEALSAVADTPAPKSERVARELAPLRKDPEKLTSKCTSFTGTVRRPLPSRPAKSYGSCDPASLRSRPRAGRARTSASAQPGREGREADPQRAGRGHAH